MSAANGTTDGSSSFQESDFKPDDIIRRDIAVIGGGSSGTYTAVRLKDHGKSVVVIEARDRLGGHAETYKDPDTGVTLNIGVIAFGQLKEVKDYLKRFSIQTTVFSSDIGAPDYVDFKTGEQHEFNPPGPERFRAACQKYAAVLMQYPEVQAGFDLQYPIAEDLLLPFGKFVEKHGLQDLVQTVFVFCQGYLPLLELTTLYVFKYFNADLLDTLAKGFIRTTNSNVGEIYEKAGAYIGAENLLLSSKVSSLDRSAETGPIKLVASTPSGRKLILASKLVSTIPHLVSNLTGYDLSPAELEVFSQFGYSSYWAGVIGDTGLTQQQAILAYSPDNAHHIPDLPGPYSFAPTPMPGVYQFYYASPHPMEGEEVKQEVIKTVKRLQERRGNHEVEPRIIHFANHTPFNLTVGPEAVRSGFYQKLYALQGQRKTFYNGATFHAQDSSVLWRYTEALLPRILA